MADTEKHLPPSEKRLHDAREQGQVASSHDLSSAFGLLAATGMLAGTASVVVGRMTNQITEMMRRMGDARTHELSATELVPLVVTGGMLIVMTAGPLAIAAAGTGALVSLLQTRFNVTVRSLRLKWERLSPASGLQKFTPSKTGLDTLKTIAIATVLAMFVWRTGRNLLSDAEHLAWASPFVSARRGWNDAMRLLWQAGFVLLAFAAADYGLQKWRMLKSLRMSHREARDEAKQDANPEIKGRIRRIQREMRRKHMLTSVPKATVVITNPTHYAVALEYNREKNPAPVVVAKGRDLMAAKIREIAREHSVSIMENPPLARALFSGCEIGDTIPGPLFGAVAEVLAYLIRIKQLVL